MKAGRTRIFVFSCLGLLFMALPYLGYSQYKLESLVGQERPPLAEPARFSATLKEKASQIIMARIGEKRFYEWVDTSYRYPHYFDNVYYNNAPSEKNYRVFFRMRPNGRQVFDVELAFRPGDLSLLTPIDEFFPDCTAHPARCSLLDNETIQQICSSKLQKLKPENPSLHFSYNAEHHCFVWHFTVQKMTEYPMGIKEEIMVNAASGKLIKREINEKFYMGR